MTPNAHDLVEKMVQAGARPEPALLEEILELGDAAVDPLRDVLRRDLRGWPEEAALTFAIGLLSDLRAEAAVPEIVGVLRRDYDELLDGMPDELGRFGSAIIAPLLDVVRDRSLDWYPRAVAIDGARRAAGPDVGQRAVVAEALRAELANCLEQSERDQDDDLPTFLVSGLADLADPLARDLIAGAFARGLVDPELTTQDDIDESFKSGGRFDEAPAGRSIDEYIREYTKERQEIEASQRSAAAAKHDVPNDLGSDLPEPEMPTEPIRRPAFRPGRNDPCWCGSGKKYKKCHLAADEAPGV